MTNCNKILEALQKANETLKDVKDLDLENITINNALELANYCYSIEKRVLEIRKKNVGLIKGKLKWQTSYLKN